MIAPQEAIKEEASIGKDGIILSGSTQDLNVQNTIMSNAQDSITPTTFFTVKRVIDGDTIDI